MKGKFIKDPIGHYGELLQTDKTYRRNDYEICSVFIIKRAEKPQEKASNNSNFTKAKKKDKATEKPLRFLTSRDFL